MFPVKGWRVMGSTMGVLSSEKLPSRMAADGVRNVATLGAPGLARRLPTAEEEGLIAANWAAKCAAELIALERQVRRARISRARRKRHCAGTHRWCRGLCWCLIA